MLRLLAFLCLLLPIAAHAQSSAQADHSRVELIAETSAPAPGSTLTLAFVMTPQRGWHTYWKNPGDAGIETRASWALPAGIKAGELRYPVPDTFIASGLMNYVYEHENALLVDLKLPAGLTPGTRLPLRVKLDWLVCDPSLCVPQSASLGLDLTVGDGRADPAVAGRFADARAALPKPVEWPARFAVQGGRFVMAAPFAQADRVRSAYFFPLVEGAVDYAAPQQASRIDGAIRIETKAGVDPNLKAVPGVLKLDVDGYDRPLGFAITAKAGTVPTTGVSLTAASPGGADIATFGLAFLAALAGGLLLNVMPCVFPILSLKALSLARGGTSEQHAKRDALAYTAGVVLICLALGGLILGLRAAGTSVGWAFQLQDPRVITLLLLLVMAVALNLAGLFEFNFGSRSAGQALVNKGGTAGAFWTGALAAFVATPCTGPFMGAALGATLVLPAAAGLAVFGGLGLGLALPFLALGFVPALRRRLPKPGPWMDRFRRLLSLPMFATALGLAWVLGRQTGVSGMTLGLAGTMGMGIALWWLGRRQAADGRPLPPLALAGAVLAAVLLAVPTARPTKAATTAGVLAAQPFSTARLDALRAQNKPVFLYFTADWCITCKVNERGALSSAAVVDRFRRAGVETMVGDWTNNDAAIGAFLESQGRNGIPLYLFYRTDGRVEVLPQLLTVDRLVGLVA